MPSIFDPITLGALKLPNRILMAPLTRARATRTHVPTPVMAEYYAQRATAGLIISEATGISQEGLGWPYAPGIWSDEQTEAWKPVVKAVHEAGGRIVCQLWHMGYLVHSDFLGGEPPVAPSVATAPWVVRIPHRPWYAAGTRIEPPVSVPRPIVACPSETAEAAPEVEPPLIRWGARGFGGVP